MVAFAETTRFTLEGLHRCKLLAETGQATGKRGPVGHSRVPTTYELKIVLIKGIFGKIAQFKISYIRPSQPPSAIHTYPDTVTCPFPQIVDLMRISQPCRKVADILRGKREK